MSVLLCGGDRLPPPSALAPGLAGLHSLLQFHAPIVHVRVPIDAEDCAAGDGENCLITARAIAGRTPAQSIRPGEPTDDDGATAGLSRDILGVAAQSQA